MQIYTLYLDYTNISCVIYTLLAIINKYVSIKVFCMDRKERFNEAFNYLRAVRLINTQVDLANAMKSSKTTISCAMAGNEKYLTDSLLLRMNHAFGCIFNDEWLIDGVGEMLAPTNVLNQTIYNGKNINSGTASHVGDANNVSNELTDVVKSQQDVIKQQSEVVKQQSEQIGKLIALIADKL